MVSTLQTNGFRFFAGRQAGVRCDGVLFVAPADGLESWDKLVYSILIPADMKKNWVVQELQGMPGTTEIRQEWCCH